MFSHDLTYFASVGITVHEDGRKPPCRNERGFHAAQDDGDCLCCRWRAGARIACICALPIAAVLQIAAIKWTGPMNGCAHNSHDLRAAGSVMLSEPIEFATVPTNSRSH